MNSAPPPAYSGSDDFIFVCYSHNDREIVFAEIARLNSAGFNIWYDDGIKPGSEWSASIASAIEGCSAFLFFVSPASVASEHCRRELNFALEESCGTLAVHLQETQVPSALRLSLSHRQAIMKYQDPRYESKMDQALQETIGGLGATAKRCLTLGEFELDLDAGTLTGDETTHLDPKDLSVLLHLIEAAPQVLSTDDLLNRSWPGAVVGDNALQQVITRLRKAFGDDAKSPTYIETQPRRGYRLLVNIDESKEETTSYSVKSGQPADSGKRYGLLIGVVAIGLVALLLALVLGDRGEVTEGDPVVAILDFDTSGLAAERQQLVKAFQSEVTTRLGRLSNLRVLSPQVLTMALKGDGSDLQILQDLGANRTVSGTAVSIQDQLSFHIVATNLGDGTQISAFHYQVSEDEFIALQSEVALAVAEVFDVEWTSEDEAHLTKETTDNLKALELKNRAHVMIGIPGSTELATNYLNEALALDPNYTDALGMLSWAHKWLADFGNPDSLELARTYAEQAMVQDRDNGWARFAMGHVMMDEGNMSEAIRHFRVGVEQLPGLRSQVDDLSTFLSYRGELVEGLYWGLEAYRLFPTNPNSRHHLALALGNLYANDHALALLSNTLTADDLVFQVHPMGRIDWGLARTAIRRGNLVAAQDYVKAIPDLPSHPEKGLIRADLEILNGKYAEAAAILKSIGERFPGYGSRVLAIDARILRAFCLLRGGLDGGEVRAKAILDSVEKTFVQRLALEPDPLSSVPMNLAAIRVLQGEFEEAMTLLDRAFDQGYRDYAVLAINPVFTELQGHPKFEPLIERMRRDVERQYGIAEAEGLFDEVNMELRKIGAI